MLATRGIAVSVKTSVSDQKPVRKLTHGSVLNFISSKAKISYSEHVTNIHFDDNSNEISSTLFVDAKYGVDSEVENPKELSNRRESTQPFATLQCALQHANTDDTIVMRPGKYFISSNLLIANVHLQCDRGVIFNFVDDDLACTIQNVTISGFAEFINNAISGIQANNFTGKVYRIFVPTGTLFHSSIDVVLKARRIECNSYIANGTGTISLKCTTMINDAENCFCVNGIVNFTCDNFTSSESILSCYNSTVNFDISDLNCSKYVISGNVGNSTINFTGNTWHCEKLYAIDSGFISLNINSLIFSSIEGTAILQETGNLAITGQIISNTIQTNSATAIHFSGDNLNLYLEEMNNFAIGINNASQNTSSLTLNKMYCSIIDSAVNDSIYRMGVFELKEGIHAVYLSGRNRVVISSELNAFHDVNNAIVLAKPVGDVLIKALQVSMKNTFIKAIAGSSLTAEVISTRCGTFLDSCLVAFPGMQPRDQFVSTCNLVSLSGENTSPLFNCLFGSIVVNYSTITCSGPLSTQLNGSIAFNGKSIHCNSLNSALLMCENKLNLSLKSDIVETATITGSSILDGKIYHSNINIDIGNYSNTNNVNNLITLTGKGNLGLAGKFTGGDVVAIKVSDNILVQTGNCRIDSKGSTIVGTHSAALILNGLTTVSSMPRITIQGNTEWLNVIE